MNEETRQLLLDILRNTERLDKVTVEADPISRTVTIRYEDLDDEWFREVMQSLSAEHAKETP